MSMTTDPSSRDDALWRDGDRFPLSAAGGEFDLSFAPVSEVGVRPFAMQEVRYSRPGESFPRHAVVTVCPARQIRLVDGRTLREMCLAAPSMTKYDTDGKDVLVVDYAEDD